MRAHMCKASNETGVLCNSVLTRRPNVTSNQNLLGVHEHLAKKTVSFEKDQIVIPRLSEIPKLKDKPDSQNPSTEEKEAAAAAAITSNVKPTQNKGILKV